MRRFTLLFLLLTGACAGDQIRIDHREGTTGNYTLLPLTTTPDYVLTFDAQGNPIIGPAAASVTPDNPTAQIGLSAVNGTASTFMRSDAAPVLDTSINPFWTGEHFFFGRVSVTDLDAYGDIYTTGNVAVVGQLDVSGNTILSKTSALNAPALSLTGSIVAGGTGVTNTPHVLIQPSAATAATDWNTRGTAIGVKTPASFGGTLLDLRRGDGAVNYSSLIKVTSGATSLFALRDDGMMEVLNAFLAGNNPAVGAATVLGSRGGGGTAGGLSIALGFEIGWTPSNQAFSASDLFMGRIGARNLRLGTVPSATPLAQTLTVGEASRPGTDSNTAGANGIIQSGLGTGTGAASSLIFQTPTLAGAGSTTQTYATRMAVAKSGVVVFTTTADSQEGIKINQGGVNPWDSTLINKSPVAYMLGFQGRADAPTPHLGVGQNNATEVGAFLDTFGIIGWGNSASVGYAPDLVLKRSGAGILLMGNAGASTDFSRLQLGGTTASFPAIKRSGAALEARLADDSASTDLTVATEVYGAGWDGDNTVPTKDAVYDKIQTVGGGAATATGYKTANQLTFSGTAINATSMSFAIAASEVWSFEFYLGIINEAGGSNPKFALDVPTGCTIGAIVNSTGTSGAFAVISADATLTTGVLGTTPGRVTITGLAQNGANAGTVQLMFASGDGINDTSIVGGQSYFVARKMN